MASTSTSTTTTASSVAPVPVQMPNFRKEDMDEAGLAYMNQWATAITARLNYLLGFGGPITLQGHLDMQGNRIMNVGAPSGASDAVNVAAGDASYGPEAVRPHLDALGKQVLQTARRLNDTTQQEQSSTFLNSLVSTSPTTNTSTVSFGTPSAGSVSLAISGGLHQRVDGSTTPYAAFSDTVTLPTSYAISTLVRAGNLVTVTTTGATPLVANETVSITGALDPTFDTQQALIVNIISPTKFTFTQFAPDVSTTGGTVSLGNVYYYYIRKETNVLARTGPFADDTWSNRLSASRDGQTIVAVIVLDGGGGIVTQSAAGNTPPSQTSGNRIIQRL